jgi:hypothetical protein
MPILLEFLKQLEHEIFEAENKIQKINPTVPEPFNLTQPQPRKILLPDPVS